MDEKTSNSHAACVKNHKRESILMGLFIVLSLCFASVPVRGGIYGVVYSGITGQYLFGTGEAYQVTLRYAQDAGIPEGEELKVAEFGADSPEYAACLEQAKEAVKGQITDAGFLDISL